MKRLIVLLFSCSIAYAQETPTIKANIAITYPQALIKKNELSVPVKEYIEKRLNQSLGDNEVIVHAKITDCNCHKASNIPCPYFPDYLPLSAFIEKDKNGSFKLNNDDTLKFSEKINIFLTDGNKLVKASLLMAKSKDNLEKIDNKQVLQELFSRFEAYNPFYAKEFKKQLFYNNSTGIIKSLNTKLLTLLRKKV